MRKLVSLLLALVMILALVPTAMADDVPVLDIYWIGNGDNAAVREGVEAAINEYVEPLIGAKVSIHIIGWDDWTTKAVTPLQSGEKIDLIFTADWREYSIEVNQGLLAPLDELVEEYGQGIKETLPQTFLDGVKVNGVLYGIPTNKELCVPCGFVVNKAAAAEIGWDVVADDPTITCTADLEPWLAAYKEKYPDKYPYLMDGGAGRWVDEPWCPDWVGMPVNIVAMKMAPAEDGTFDETIYNILATPEQEEHIRLMYKWAQAGYIDPEAALTTFDYNSIFGRGDFLVYCQPLKGNGIKAAEINQQYGGGALDLVEITMQPKCVVTTHAGGSMFAIPEMSEYKVEAMKYLNLMHSDATLVNLMLFGVEGVNYEKVDDVTVQVNNDASWYGVHGGAWTVGNTKLQYVTVGEDPAKNELLQSYASDAVATASLGFRFDKGPVADEVTAVSNVVDEYVKALMCGQVDPDDPAKGIAAANAALEEAGIGKIIEEVQNQYDAWKAAQE